MNNEASSTMVVHDIPIEVDFEKPRMWGLPREENLTEHSRSRTKVPGLQGDRSQQEKILSMNTYPLQDKSDRRSPGVKCKGISSKPQMIC